MATIELTRIHYQNWYIRKMRLQCFQQGMDSHKRENFAHTSKHQHITALMWLELDFLHKLTLANSGMELIQKKDTTILRFHIRNCIRNPHIFTDGNKRTALVMSLAMLWIRGIVVDGFDSANPETNEVYRWIQDVVSGEKTGRELAVALREMAHFGSYMSGNNR